MVWRGTWHASIVASDRTKSGSIVDVAIHSSQDVSFRGIIVSPMKISPIWGWLFTIEVLIRIQRRGFKEDRTDWTPYESRESIPSSLGSLSQLSRPFQECPPTSTIPSSRRFRYPVRPCSHFSYTPRQQPPFYPHFQHTANQREITSNHGEITHSTGAHYHRLPALEVHNLRCVAEAISIKSKVLASIDDLVTNHPQTNHFWLSWQGIPKKNWEYKGTGPLSWPIFSVFLHRRGFVTTRATIRFYSPTLTFFNLLLTATVIIMSPVQTLPSFNLALRPDHYKTVLPNLSYPSRPITDIHWSGSSAPLLFSVSQIIYSSCCAAALLSFFAFRKPRVQKRWLLLFKLVMFFPRFFSDNWR